VTAVDQDGRGGGLDLAFDDGGYQGPQFAEALQTSCRISTLKSSTIPIGSAGL
jgi:hypothetical protein